MHPGSCEVWCFPSAGSGSARQLPYAEGHGEAVGSEGAAQAGPLDGRRRAGVGVVNKMCWRTRTDYYYPIIIITSYGIEHRKTMHDLPPLDACPYRPK